MSTLPARPPRHRRNRRRPRLLPVAAVVLILLVIVLASLWVAFDRDYAGYTAAYDEVAESAPIPEEVSASAPPEEFPTAASPEDRLPDLIPRSSENSEQPQYRLERPRASESPAVAEFAEVEVLYGTSRRRSPSPGTATSTFYGSGRGSLQFGSARVSIPRDHRPGMLESPVWYRLEFRADPERHVVLMSVTPMAPTEWRSRFRQLLGYSERGEALVFVHGYNVTFTDAARRTAQLAYDLRLDGVPVMYSWPSRGSLAGYTADEATAEWAVPHFQQFLREVSALTGNGRVHVIAHSMGNRIVANALRTMGPGPRPLLNQVILTAPDIDAQVFEEQIVPAIRGSAARISLYASSNDRALQASQEVHAFRRAGQSGPDIVVLEGLETIDASGIDTDLLGHAYFAGNKQMIDDLFMLVRHDLPASERNLRPRQKRGRPYWALQ